MKIWKKSLALLLALVLFAGAVPMAFAEETAESQPEETTQATEETTAPTQSALSASMSSVVDYSALQVQIAMVNGMNRYDYTNESWEPLQKALDKGKRTLDSKLGQMSVDEAVKAIQDAQTTLVKMNYAPLENALAEVYNLIKENPELHDLWIRLNTAVAESKPLLVSGDQKAVDEAAAMIGAMLEEQSQYANVEVPPEVVIQEVQVEVPPTGAFCNIPMHRTWPTLFFISAALNVGLLVLLGYVILRKRKTVDDTPLVSYDIDDDMDFE